MPGISHVIETALYSLVNLMPYLFMLLYPFRDSYRFSRAVVRAIVFLIALIQIALGLWAAYFPDTPSSVKSVTSTVIYIVFYFVAVRGNFGKQLFTLLLFSNLSNLVVMMSKCLEGFLFPDMAVQQYRWTFTLMMLLFQVIFLTPIYFYYRRVYIPAIHGGTGQAIWKYMWIIPLTFYVLWSYIIYNSPLSPLQMALLPQNSLFILLINIGAFIVYHVVISFSAEQQKNLALKAQNHMLELQKLEYESFTSKLSEVRRINHDVRHNIILMNEYLKSGRYEELGKLFTEYLKTIPDNITLTYCSHYALNMLISYFAQLSAQDGIEFECDVRITETLNLSESDLSVLVGNLLENAVEACRRIADGRRTVALRGNVINESVLLITVDNTYTDEPVTNADGVLTSTKRSGAGIGVESVKLIVGKYNGQYKAQTENGLYQVSVMLNLPHS